MCKPVLVLWVLSALTYHVQGQQYNVTACPLSCVCEQPSHIQGWSVLNAASIQHCNTDPHQDLVSILHTYPSMDGLQIHSSHMTGLPTEVGVLTWLRVLDISNMSLLTLPDTLGKLSALRWLYTNNNRLTALPDTIGSLLSLEWLDISNNHLLTLPDTIGQLSSLELLYASNNSLATLPNSIGDLSLLDELDINDNKLQVLPDSIGQLSSLEELNINNNHLMTLPGTIGQLSVLRQLDISHNQLSSLPDGIGYLPRVQELNLANNHLLALPNTIGQLSALEWLDVSNNRLSVLPWSIGSLISLEELYVNNNSLSTLPDILGYMSSLKVLQVSDNLLQVLPYTIGQLLALCWLYVPNNQLTVLPNTLWSLSVLNVSHNQLSSLPAAAGPSLQKLYASSNRLTTLPGTMGQSLRVMDVSNNALTALPLGAPGVQIVRAAHNNITAVNISTIMSTPHMKIDLSNNLIVSLGTLPAGTSGPDFELLDLSSNHLKSLDLWYFRSGVGVASTLYDTSYTPQYTSLNVSNNVISDFTNYNGYSSLSNASDTVKWQVDLSHNAVHYLHNITEGLNITRQQLEYLVTSEYLTLTGNPLRCNADRDTVCVRLRDPPLPLPPSDPAPPTLVSSSPCLHHECLVLLILSYTALLVLVVPD